MSFSKIQRKAGDLAELAECLPNMHKALGSPEPYPPGMRCMPVISAYRWWEQRLEAECHSWLCSKFKAILDYISSFLMKKTRELGVVAHTHHLNTFWRPPDNGIARSRPPCLQSVGGLGGPSVGMWHGIGILDTSRYVLGCAKNTGTRVRVSLMQTHLFLGAHFLAVLFLAERRA